MIKEYSHVPQWQQDATTSDKHSHAGGLGYDWKNNLRLNTHWGLIDGIR